MTLEDFIQVGKGNVDSVEIMLNGDIQNFPEKSSTSNDFDCDIGL